MSVSSVIPATLDYCYRWHDSPPSRTVNCLSEGKDISHAFLPESRRVLKHRCAKDLDSIHKWMFEWCLVLQLCSRLDGRSFNKMLEFSLNSHPTSCHHLWQRSYNSALLVRIIMVMMSWSQSTEFSETRLNSSVLSRNIGIWFCCSIAFLSWRVGF